MKILALELSSDHRSAAVAEGDPAVPARILSVARETGPRVTHAFALIEQALQQAHWQRAEIECIAVGLGPGSYTGIRVAIAVAQGWQLARGVKALGLNTADTLAAQAHALGWTGRHAVVIDAQRGEFYLATYELVPGVVEPQLIAPLHLASLDEVQRRADQGETLITVQNDPRLTAARILTPDAGMLATLAARSRNFVGADRLEPIYLRETSFVKAPAVSGSGTSL